MIKSLTHICEMFILKSVSLYLMQYAFQICLNRGLSAQIHLGAFFFIK